MPDLFLLGYLAGTIPLCVLLVKGRVAMFFAAFLVSLVPVLGPAFALATSIRMAKPNSWWARRYYGAAKRKQARERYPDASTEPAVASAVCGFGLLVLWGPVALLLSVFVPT